MDTNQVRSVVGRLLEAGDEEELRAITDPLIAKVDETVDEMAKMITKLRRWAKWDNKFLYLAHLQRVTTEVYDKDEIAMILGAALFILSEIKEESIG